MENRVKVEEEGVLYEGLSDSGEVDIDGLLNLEEEDEKNEKKRVLGYPSPLSSPSTFNSKPATYSSRMLCFGGGMNYTSSSPSSPTFSNNSLSKQNTKGKQGRLGGGQKRPKRDQQSSSTNVNTNGGAPKVRKEKLGERIMALQQLVSPFGKSDTASVLHEALGYIKFLHDQVQVLSSPYLQQLPSPSQVGRTRTDDLKSRGLCLVSVSCTEHVAGDNGADLWSTAMWSNAGDVNSKH